MSEPKFSMSSLRSALCVTTLTQSHQSHFLLTNKALPLGLDLSPHHPPGMSAISPALLCSYLFSCPSHSPLNGHSASGI